MIMDQSKAFDVIDHELLVKKMKILGLDHHSLITTPQLACFVYDKAPL